MANKISAKDVLLRYAEEELPEFVGIILTDVNQKGGFGNTPLNLACTRGSIEEVRALLDGGANPDIQGEHGCTPLHDAVGQGHKEIVRCLLENGADPTISNDERITPQERALQKKFTEVAALFDDIHR